MARQRDRKGGICEALFPFGSPKFTGSSDRSCGNNCSGRGFQHHLHECHNRERQPFHTLFNLLLVHASHLRHRLYDHERPDAVLSRWILFPKPEFRPTDQRTAVFSGIEEWSGVLCGKRQVQLDKPTERGDYVKRRSSSVRLYLSHILLCIVTLRSELHHGLLHALGTGQSFASCNNS